MNKKEAYEKIPPNSDQEYSLSWIEMMHFDPINWARIELIRKEQISLANRHISILGRSGRMAEQTYLNFAESIKNLAHSGIIPAEYLIKFDKIAKSGEAAGRSISNFLIGPITPWGTNDKLDVSILSSEIESLGYVKNNLNEAGNQCSKMDFPLPLDDWRKSMAVLATKGVKNGL